MAKETVTLKELFISQIQEMKENVKTALISLDKRLDGMNEFRDTLRDQAGRFITREEMDARLDTIRKDIETLQKIVWMGLGAITVIQVLLKFFIK